MEKITKICPLIKGAMPPSSKWEMDDRMPAVLVVFQKDDVEAIRTTITALFESQYDSTSIKKGTDIHKKVASSLSGISGKQILFIMDDGALVLFGAWWPWGDGAKVSLRVGIFTLNDEMPGKSEILKYLKKFFL